MGRRPLAVLVVLLLAGCTGAVREPAPGGDATDRLAYLGALMTLDERPPEAPAAVRAGSFFQHWADGMDYPTWVADPLDHDVLVEGIALTVFARVTGPVTTTVRFPDVMAYAGSGDAWLGYAASDTDAVLVPGRTYKLTFAPQVPPGGLWVPAGEPFGVKVVPVLTQGEANDFEVLLGPDTPSAVEWTQRAVTLEAREMTTGRDTGEVAGSAYAGAAAPSTTSHATTVPLARAPERLVAWMNTTDHSGIPDLDFSLVGPGGSVIASAGTPTPREAIRVAAPNTLPPGDYRLVVTSYGSARAAFTVEWRAG